MNTFSIAGIPCRLLTLGATARFIQAERFMTGRERTIAAFEKSSGQSFLRKLSADAAPRDLNIEGLRGRDRTIAAFQQQRPGAITPTHKGKLNSDTLTEIGSILQTLSSSNTPPAEAVLMLDRVGNILTNPAEVGLEARVAAGKRAVALLRAKFNQK